MNLKYLKMLMVAGSSIILFSNCSKDDDPDPTPSTTNFSPSTANSTWTYKNTPGSTFTLTATSRDSVAMGRTYKVFTSSTGKNIYMVKEGSNYYRFGSFAEAGIAGVEELYLKDDQPVNGTWLVTQTFMVTGIPAPLTANLTYTIKEKSISRTVGTKAFTNVIHVRLDIAIAGFGPIGNGEFYYAEGVGMIENEIHISVPSQPPVNQTQLITDYSIK